MSHLDDGLLHAWLDGEVDAAEDERVQGHLEGCPECAERLGLAARDRAAASELLGELGEGPRLLPHDASGGGGEAVIPFDAGTPVAPERARPTEGPGWGRGLAWAASIVLAVALGWFARTPATSPQEAGGAAAVAAADDELADADEGAAPARRSIADPTPAEPAEKLLAQAAPPVPEPEIAEATAVVAEAEVPAGDAAGARAVPEREAAVGASELADAIAPETAAPAPAPQQARFRQAAQEESALPAGRVMTASPPPSMWLGREPLLPAGARVVAIELLPAEALEGSVGSAPVVVLDVVLVDGRSARLFEQRVDEREAEAAAGPEADSVEARDHSAAGRAAAIIDGILVLVEGPDAGRLLEMLREQE